LEIDDSDLLDFVGSMSDDSVMFESSPSQLASSTFDWSKANVNPIVAPVVQPFDTFASTATITTVANNKATQTTTRSNAKSLTTTTTTRTTTTSNPPVKRHATRRAAPASLPDSGSQSPGSSSSHSSLGKTLLSPRSKKERRRERNRELASLSRERRKLEFDALKKENDELRAKLAKFECANPKALGAVGLASFLALCADSNDPSSVGSTAAVLVAYINVLDQSLPSQFVAVVSLFAVGLLYTALVLRGNLPRIKRSMPLV